MTTPSLNLTQLNAILRGSNSLSPRPTFSQLPYLTPEIFEGDAVNFSPGVSPDGTLSSPQVMLNAVSQGFGYTTVPGDAGKVLIVTQVSTATVGTTTTGSSDPVTVQAPIKFKDQLFDGGNLEGTGPASRACWYFNAFFDSRGWGTLGTFAGCANGVGTITFSASSGAGVAATVSGTSVAMFVSSDVGKTIIAGGVDVATITAFTDQYHVTVTLNGTLPRLAYSCWYYSVPLDANGFPLTPSSVVLTGGSSAQRTITSAYIVSNVLTVVTMGGTTALSVGDQVSGPGGMVNTNILQQLSGNPGEAGTYQIDTSQNVGSAGSPVSMTILSMDGNLAAGTYHGTYTSRDVGTPAVLTVESGATAGTVLTIGSTVGADTSFTLVVPRGATVALRFSQSISFADLPYDGSSTSSGKGLFRPEMLAHWAQFVNIRVLDLMGINGPSTINSNSQVNWEDRPRAHAVFPTRWNAGGIAWERLCEFMNAVYRLSGSRMRYIWCNMPGLVTPSYGLSLATLFNSLLDPGIIVIPELGNEPWNPSFALGKLWTALAAKDAHVVTNYGLSTIPVASVTANGTTTVTVKTTSALSTFVDPTTGLSYITEGATVVVENESSGIWNTPVSSAGVHLGSTIHLVDATTFTYTAGAAVAAQTMASSSQWAAWFNMSSNLVADGGGVLGTLNFYNLNFKYGVRQTYLIQQQWKTVRAQDRFIINIQTYGQFVQGGNDTQPIHYGYGDWLSRTYFGTGALKSWLYGGAIAPYVTGTSGTTVNSDTFWNSVSANLAVVDLKIKGHVYACRTFGVHPVAYECGPDFSGSPAIPIQMHTDPRAGQLLTNLFNSWFKNGGENINWFFGSPRPLVNGAGNTGWGLLQSYGDQSVKMQAFRNYATTRDYSTGLSNYGGLTTAYYRRTSPKRAGVLAAPNNGVYWGAATYDRLVGYHESFARTRRRALTVWGTDKVAGTVVTVWMDAVQIGTATLPPNGSGNLVGSASGPAASPPIVVVIPAGGHSFEVKIAAGSGAMPSIAGITVADA